MTRVLSYLPVVASFAVAAISVVAEPAWLDESPIFAAAMMLGIAGVIVGVTVWIRRRITRQRASSERERLRSMPFVIDTTQYFEGVTSW